MNIIRKLGTIGALVGAFAGCGKQDVQVPSAEIGREAKVWVTRNQRIEISRDEEGNEYWYSKPHDGGRYSGRGRTTTTYFKDGRIRLYDLDQRLTWDYGSEGTTMMDQLGNRYRVERQEQ